MNQVYILVISMGLGLLCYSLIAKWYLMPYLSKLPAVDALTPLLLLHSFRYVGLAFLIPGVVSFNLSPAFALPAAYGDLITALLALLAIMALRLEWKIAIALVWIFNVVGVLDLLTAIYQALSHTVPSQFQAAYFIPTVIVPLLLVTHYMIFVMLFRRRNA